MYVYVYVYVYVFVCMYVCIYICMQACMRVCMSLFSIRSMGTPRGIDPTTLSPRADAVTLKYIPLLYKVEECSSFHCIPLVRIGISGSCCLSLFSCLYQLKVQARCPGHASLMYGLSV